MQLFKDDDMAYAEWRATHPNGFILNLNYSPTPATIHLHRTDCSQLNKRRPANGRRWTHTYNKVCAVTRAALERWAETHGNEISECQHCRPANAR